LAVVLMRRASINQLAEEQVMHTFIFDPRRWWVAPAVSRNPLVRRIDRVEPLAIMLAIVVSLLVIPVAGAVGTAVYDDRADLYAQEARTRHPVTATITENGIGPVDPYSGAVVVQARWAANGGGRTASLQWKDPVKPGDRIQVWLDADGNPVDAPSPTSHAGFEAATIAVSIAVLVIGVSASLVAAARWWLDRIRYAQLEREIQNLVGGDGGRTSGADPGRPR
jgi:hypothetical protein